jgi:hypothetical protein
VDNPSVDSERPEQTGWRAWLAHAFAVDKYDESSLSEEQQDILTRLAIQIKSRGLAPAAILWLQSNRHMGWLGSQVLVAATPVYDLAHQFVHPFLRQLGIYVKPEEMPLLTEALEKRYSVEYLVQRIEAAQVGEIGVEAAADVAEQPAVLLDPLQDEDAD